ncbi:hypothetical protein OAB20_03905 [Winogradskyella sp.]|nr:hypothetical protein [Winogradskyella sp.]
MKNFNFTKKLKVVALGVAFLTSGLIFAQLTHEGDNTATNCTFTGNSADYCNASNGQQNLRIINCKPGSTSCYY